MVAKPDSSQLSVTGVGSKPYSPSRDAWKRLRKNKGAMLGLFVVIALLFAALLAPILSTHDPISQDRSVSFRSPSKDNLFGTDMFGRDVFSRLLYGARISLRVGFISVLISAVGGITLGLLAGYFRGWVEAAVQSLTEILLAFPGILLALVIIAMLGPDLFNLMIAVGISSLPRFIRIVRGSTLSITQNAYVDAAVTSGCSNLRIMFRHILPNMLGPVIVLSTMGVANAILVGASLSYLGLGAQPPTPEWGAMLAGGRNYMLRAPWLTIYPGLAIMLTVLGINLLGDGLRDALDPKMKI